MKGKLLTLIMAFLMFQIGRWALDNADVRTFASRGFWIVALLSLVGYTLYLMSALFVLSVIFRRRVQGWVTQWTTPPARPFAQSSHCRRLPSISIDQRSKLQKFADKLDEDLRRIDC